MTEFDNNNMQDGMSLASCQSAESHVRFSKPLESVKYQRRFMVQVQKSGSTPGSVIRADQYESGLKVHDFFMEALLGHDVHTDDYIWQKIDLGSK